MGSLAGLREGHYAQIVGAQRCAAEKIVAGDNDRSSRG